MFGVDPMAPFNVSETVNESSSQVNETQSDQSGGIGFQSNYGIEGIGEIFKI